MILAIDPSSTRTGYCVMQHDMSLIEAGAVTPSPRAKDALERIESMTWELLDNLAAYEPSHIIVEIPSGKTHRRLQSTNISGLPIYGMAVGYICSALYYKLDVDITGVNDNDWTGGQKKATRAYVTRSLYPELNNKKDSGMDIADAVGLARWWIEKQRLEGGK